MRRFTVPPFVLLLLVVAVGILFAAGLFTHGALGGVLLLVTVAILVGLTLTNQEQTNPRAQQVRYLVVVLIAVLALVKLTGRA